MSHMFRAAPLALLCFLLLGCFENEADPEILAREAFFSIEAQPFDNEVGSKAAKDVDLAYSMAPTDPWVLIAVSRLLLERGYLAGDRSRLESYRTKDLIAASDFARRAVELGANESMAHVQLARIQLINGNYREAWNTLNKAHELDADGFYPWYYRGVVSLKMNDAKRAAEYLAAAEEKAKLPFQRMWAIDRRIDVAHLQGDIAEEERIYKLVIELDPTDAYSYGQYAIFLKKQKRYDEAISTFKKAIEITPYPRAIEQMNRTIQLRDSEK